MQSRFLILIFVAVVSGLAFSPAPQTAPSHQAWHDQLQAYVSSSGSVNYQEWKQNSARLDGYLAELESNAPSSGWSRNEQLAYWINAYNAYTVKLILDNYPIRSITDLGTPWDKKFINIGGTSYSLNDIEHNILREKLKEYRVHFAVNCASVSCPPLLNKAYKASNVEQLLDQQARRFINDARYNDIAGSELALSKIFDWYGADFKKSGTLIEYLNKYAETAIPADATVGFKDYNWNLNGR